MTLAFAIDAAEPRLVRDLVAHGELPSLEKLLARGRWLRVESPARIGSGAVWPTFLSGRELALHGIYGEWLWRPSTMSVTRYAGSDLQPFWKAFVEGGLRVGIFDLPFMPVIGVREGFEVSEWGPHDVSTDTRASTRQHWPILSRRRRRTRCRGIGWTREAPTTTAGSTASRRSASRVFDAGVIWPKRSSAARALTSR